MDQLLVILDLDETLIHAKEKGLIRGLPVDFYAGPFPVYKRPDVDLFIQQLFLQYKVAVWTSASPLYAREVVNNLFGKYKDRLEFVWDSTRCTWGYDPYWQRRRSYKKLYKVRRKGYNIERVIAIDDTPSKWAHSYGNLVRVPEWEGEQDDTILYRLLPYLQWLNMHSNVRAVEKRGWYK